MDRFNRGGELGGMNTLHPGALLLAHPALLDPNFSRSVILLSAHSEEEGSIGLILNRPIGQTLGEFDPELAESSLADVPLYTGGPVAKEQLILVAWKWSEEESAFKLYFGIDGERAERILLEDNGFRIRGFLGRAGWTSGQLDAELGQNSWVLSASLPALKDNEDMIDWHQLLCMERPELRLLADAPEEPSLN